jgi:DNA-binding transcriptional LysR family regulator
MELRQLEYFIAVVDEGGFTRAAERLRVAQPGVSAAIAKLERELGQPLLHRSGRRTEITEAGQAVLPYARAALHAVAGAQAAVDELSGVLRGRVAVGMVTACSAVELSTLLATFHREHPGVEVQLSEATSDALVDGLREGRLDLAWVALSGPAPAGVESRTLIDEPYVAAVAPEHPLATRSVLAVADLRDLPLACLPQGSGQRAAVERACAAAGFAPRVAFEGSALDTLAELAAQDIAVAILPRSVAAALGARLRPMLIDDQQLRGRVALAWRAGGPSAPAGRALLRVAQRENVVPGR